VDDDYDDDEEDDDNVDDNILHKPQPLEHNLYFILLHSFVINLIMTTYSF
jgi:hypothetical protein